MRKSTLIFGSALLIACVTNAAAGTITVNTNDDPSVVSCPAICTLRQAIVQANAGDTIVFATTVNSPITLIQGELLVNKALTINGPGAGVLTISAQNASRVFHIAADVSIGEVTIADGAVTGANGNAGAAGMGDGGSGAAGGSGKTASGACVLVDSGFTAVLAAVAIRHCVATGGNGGAGGIGAPGKFSPPFPGGNGGIGGYGGTATGAAIQSNGSLSLLNSSVTDAHALAGNGGNGGIGVIGIPPGFGGQGGVGGAALGGAVAAGNGTSLHIINSSIGASSATGGNGGAGGTGDNTGIGGSGGYATGGLLYVESNVIPADLEFSTLVNGSVTGGLSGPLGPGDGIPSGNAINAASTFVVASSIVVGAQGNADLCYGSVAAATGSVNLSETTTNSANPSTCNSFSLHATFASTLKPLDANATPAYLPIWQSPVIDAAINCLDITAQTVSSDQHGTPRPQGSTCDLGSIEADYLFVDGFEQ